jgi:hypothetical protein
MRRDFEISQGIYLVQPPHELDLHNNFDFLGLDYSVEHRTLLLRWRFSRTGEWAAFADPSNDVYWNSAYKRRVGRCDSFDCCGRKWSRRSNASTRADGVFDNDMDRWLPEGLPDVI